MTRGPTDSTGQAPWRLSAHEFGALGEELAARFLRSRGLRLVGRNVRAAEAELDIVGVEGQTLVVVEVKAGWWPVAPPDLSVAAEPHESPSRWTPRRPGARVTDRALARRRSAARRLALCEGLEDGRVDVVEVITGRGSTAVILHHRRFALGSLPPRPQSP